MDNSLCRLNLCFEERSLKDLLQWKFPALDYTLLNWTWNNFMNRISYAIKISNLTKIAFWDIPVLSNNITGQVSTHATAAQFCNMDAVFHWTFWHSLDDSKWKSLCNMNYEWNIEWNGHQMPTPIKRFWLNFKFDQNTFVYIFSRINLITYKFCTFQDSTAVLEYAKFPLWLDQFSLNYSEDNFHRIRIWLNYL